MSSGAAGVDRDLGGGLDLGRLQAVQAGAQHGHDLRRQVPSGLAAPGSGREVTVEADAPGRPAVACPGRVSPRARIPVTDRVCAPLVLSRG